MGIQTHIQKTKEGYMRVNSYQINQAHLQTKAHLQGTSWEGNLINKKKIIAHVGFAIKSNHESILNQCQLGDMQTCNHATEFPLSLSCTLIIICKMGLGVT